MYLPDYKGGSIVNLMSSIASAFGSKTQYDNLRVLGAEELKKAKNIIILEIDGLGNEYLINSNAEYLKSNNRGPITSTFLATTACATTVFETGVAPQQHGLTGWFMFLKEAGMVVKILPFNPRIGGKPISEQGIKMEDIFNEQAFTEKIKTKSFIFMPESYSKSDFTRSISGNSKIVPFTKQKELFKKIKSKLNGPGRKYMFAHWPQFDGYGHDRGVASTKCKKHLKELELNIKKFVKSIEGTDTILIITADHGLIDTPKNKEIKLESHSQLKDCLTIPLCGEGRTVYCYVKPSKVKEFEDYVKKNLSNYCEMYKSEEIIKNNWYGLGKPNPKLFDRVGDYILIMKENYILKDKIELHPENNKGHHAGTSKQEMLVPLIVIKT